MVVNSNAIIELVKLEENIYNYFEFISLDDDKKDVYISYLTMFLSKEKRIFSELPIDDQDFNDFILESLDDVVMENIENSDNYNFISSRISSYFHDCNLKIKPESQFANVFDGENYYVKDNYEKFVYNVNCREYYKNLIVRYLKQVEDLKDLGIYDDILSKIQRYNLYIETHLFDEYVNSDFDIYSLSSLSDDDMRMKFSYDEDMFSNLKNGIICSKLYELVVLMFNNSSDSTNYLDAELNLKYFLSELSYDKLFSFISDFDDFLKYFFERTEKDISDFKDTIDLICKDFNEELSRKNDRNDEYLLAQNDYDRLCNFVSLEKVIFSSIQKMDFESNDVESVKNISSLLDIEDEFVNDLNDISIMDLSHFFTFSLSEILDDNNLFNLINYRVFHLFSAFKFLSKNPGQSNDSFEMINMNYVISCIRKFYSLINNIEDDEIKSVFYDVYKNQFYSNPFLTRLFTQFDGNHLIIEPLSFDISFELSNVTDLEYKYDMNHQLFPEAIDIIQKLVLFDTNIQDTENAYFHFWLIQFDYICRCLDNESLDGLSDLLLERFQDSSCFDILINIVYFNLNGINYDLDISISSSNTKINVLTLGG